MPDIAFLPAHELARRLRRRELGSLELLEHYLARIGRLNPKVNAVIALDAERARERARAADDALARGEGQVWGPLHGLPMTVKESFNVAGLPTTYGYPAFADSRAKDDAITVQRLKAAGAVIFGKTNVPVALADWQSFNPVYGTTSNPWDLARTPGGSSGGSAAALAAGLTGLELGSDIGASIRNPAHYCGVWGLKPTWGVVPQAGHELTPVPCADNIDIAAVGPLARSAFDLTLAMDVLCQPLSTCTPTGRVPLAWPTRGTPPRRCRVAIVSDDAEARVDAPLREALARLADFLRREGVHVDEQARPVDSAEAHAVYLHLLRAATGARFDDADYAAAQARAPRYAAGDTSYPARMDRGTTTGHREWVQMDQRRDRLRLQWAAFFERFDLLICPTATTPAFVQNQQGQRWERLIPVRAADGRTLQQPTTDALFWAGYPGLVGLPACAVPLELAREDSGGAPRLPVGAQIVGPAYGDMDVLAFARWLESEYRSFEPPALARAA
ncbi:MAG: amidase [Burkholderiales bacterium]|nr:amidase [Burkholderiales bacterium]